MSTKQTSGSLPAALLLLVLVPSSSSEAIAMAAMCPIRSTSSRSFAWTTRIAEISDRVRRGRSPGACMRTNALVNQEFAHVFIPSPAVDHQSSIRAIPRLRTTRTTRADGCSTTMAVRSADRARRFGGRRRVQQPSPEHRHPNVAKVRRWSDGVELHDPVDGLLHVPSLPSVRRRRGVCCRCCERHRDVCDQAEGAAHGDIVCGYAANRVHHPQPQTAGHADVHRDHG